MVNNVSTGRGPSTAAMDERKLALVAEYGDELGEAVYRIQQHLQNDRQFKGGTGVMVLSPKSHVVIERGQIHADMSISQLQTEISEWADTVLPDRTPEMALRKLMEHEIPELCESGLDDPLEYADVLIIVLDIARLKGIDAGKAVLDKMKINRGRTWQIDATTGLMSHVKGPNVK